MNSHQLGAKDCHREGIEKLQEISDSEIQETREVKS